MKGIENLLTGLERILAIDEHGHIPYCSNCNLAGDIEYLWGGEMGCLNCGRPLYRRGYEFVKGEKATMVSKVQREKVEIDYP